MKVEPQHLVVGDNSGAELHLVKFLAQELDDLLKAVILSPEHAYHDEDEMAAGVGIVALQDRNHLVQL